MSKLTDELDLSSVFSYPTYEQWKVEAEKLLKGAPFEKIMKTDTVEGITLEAIYNVSDLDSLDFVEGKPGMFPYIRGNTGTRRVVKGWDVQQEVVARDLVEWNKIVIADLKKGQTSFSLNLNADVNYTDLQTALSDIPIADVHFDISVVGDILNFFNLFEKYLYERQIDIKKLSGSITTDVFRSFAEKNTSPAETSKILDDIATISKKTTNLKTISIDICGFNNLGSSATQDIGLMAAMVVYYTEAMVSRGLTPDEAFSQMTFRFAVNSNMFMEIAKLRAARFVFAKLSEAYKVKPENAKMRLHVQTSEYTKTFFDPWVNILRTTTEAFSAIIGGCDSLHVTPFDIAIQTPDEFSRRIARNQQLVLLHESHLNAVNDPAGGSYYVEALTNKIVKKGWEYFLQIESSGGVMENLINGKLLEQMNHSHEYRLKNAETRKDAIVGTSTFPNLAEKRFSGEQIPQKSTNSYAKRRLSESFEALRLRVETLPTRPKMFVVNIGKVVKNKPRVDFCLSYFEPAGFDVQTNDGFETVEAGLDFALNSDAQVIVLCSTDDVYPEVVPTFAKQFREKSKKVLVLAGYPKEHIETFTASGVEFYVYMRQNIVKTITDILKRMGV
jgi:methylmalonyl-CoA mutase